MTDLDAIRERHVLVHEPEDFGTNYICGACRNEWFEYATGDVSKATRRGCDTRIVLDINEKAHLVNSGVIHERDEARADADRLADVLGALRREGNRPAGRGKYISHAIDVTHGPGIVDDDGRLCLICNALAQHDEAQR